MSVYVFILYEYIYVYTLSLYVYYKSSVVRIPLAPVVVCRASFAVVRRRASSVVRPFFSFFQNNESYSSRVPAGGPQRGNPTMTTSTIRARRKGGPQQMIKCAPLHGQSATRAIGPALTVAAYSSPLVRVGSLDF